MSENTRFLTFSHYPDPSKKQTFEVAVNVGLARVIKHQLGENDGDFSTLLVYFIDEPEPCKFIVTEKTAETVILRLREIRS